MRFPSANLFLFSMVLLTALFLSNTGLAQTPNVEAKQNLDKPTLTERLANRTLNPAPLRGRVPVAPVHCVAEWEESEGIMTLWKNADLMNKLQQDHQVYIPVDDAAEETWWINFYNTNSIPLDNVHFLYIQTGTMWTRDYGPWFIWDGNNEMGVVNYTCNYSYDDDLFPINFSSLYGIEYYESSLYHVGGNYYPNAYGRAFSSTHVYESNGDSTKAEVDDLMTEYFGIEKYQTVAPKGIWHHDTWGKPANPETLIIVDFPEYNKNRHAQADGMVAYYATLESPWGRPYKIHRLPMMPQTAGGTNYRPYMNTLVSNKDVFVPIHDCPDDAVALGVFQDGFVGYNVVGVIAHECEWHDALHCRTRNFVKREVIRLYAYPPGDTEETVAGYPVRAEVIPPNGSSLLAGYPVIHWTTTGGAPFTDLVMAPTGQPNEYAADLPGQAQGTEVSYYIEAKDDGGLETIYPLVAPDGMMSFQVRPDNEAPVISRFQAARYAAAGQWPASVRTLCKDDMATPAVRMEYAINGVPQPDIAMDREELCYWYNADLQGSVVAGDLISYRLVAEDGAQTPNVSYQPKLGQVYCPVVGPGSIAVVNLSRRPCTAPFLTETLGNLDIPYHYYSQWPTDWNEHDVWFICLGMFGDNYILSSTEAADIAAALQAGDSIYLEGGNTWCNDPEATVLNPLFGVSSGDHWKSMSKGIGLPGTIMAGLDMWYVAEDLQMDEINAVAPAVALMESQDGRCRLVLQDQGGYRTIASAFALGGLLDKSSPQTRKEILLQYLEFFGVGETRLRIAGTPIPGNRIQVQIEGTPGDTYILLASRADGYLLTDYGLLRQDALYTWFPRLGVIPAEGVVSLPLTVPSDVNKVGKDFYFQALVGATLDPGIAVLTNRDIVTILAP